jgi:hypothetical protein
MDGFRRVGKDILRWKCEDQESLLRRSSGCDADER